MKLIHDCMHARVSKVMKAKKKKDLADKKAAKAKVKQDKKDAKAQAKQVYMCNSKVTKESVRFLRKRGAPLCSVLEILTWVLLGG
jgi:hypothetical protein